MSDKETTKINTETEIEVGIYELSFSIREMVEDLQRKADLILSVLDRGNYKLILRRVENDK